MVRAAHLAGLLEAGHERVRRPLQLKRLAARDADYSIFDSRDLRVDAANVPPEDDHLAFVL